MIGPFLPLQLQLGPHHLCPFAVQNVLPWPKQGVSRLWLYRHLGVSASLLRGAVLCTLYSCMAVASFRMVTTKIYIKIYRRDR